MRIAVLAALSLIAVVARLPMLPHTQTQAQETQTQQPQSSAEAPAVLPSPVKPPPGASVEPLFRGTTTASGQPITLPVGAAEVIVSRYTIPPGVKLPVHRHPYPRYGFVEAGTIRVSTPDGGRSSVYRTGDFIVEMIDQWHFGETIGSETVKLLVIDQVKPGTNNTVLQTAPGHDHGQVAAPETKPPGSKLH